MAAKVSKQLVVWACCGNSYQITFNAGITNKPEDRFIRACSLTFHQNFIDNIFQFLQVERFGEVDLGPGMGCQQFDIAVS